MIIKGKSIILSLSLLVVVAVIGYYLMNAYLTRLPVWAGDLGEPLPTGGSGGSLPDYQEPTKDFYNEHRLEREKQRSLQLDLLREVVNNSNTSTEVRAEAQKIWLSLTTTIEKELTIEKLVIGKGYKDALLLLNDGAAHLLVKTDVLTPAEAIQIMEIVASTLDIDAVRVRVIERK